MADIIREDVVKIGWDIDSNPLIQLQKEINELKKKLSGGMGDDEMDDLKDSAEKAKKPFEELKNKVGDVSNKLTHLGQKAAKVAFNGLKKVASITFKGLGIALGAVATGIGKIGYEAVKAFADFEQLKGGVETLFGAGGLSIEDYADSVGKSVGAVKGEYNKLMKAQDTVLKNANDAYKTAGLSANDYMETVTGFAASLKQSVGGDTVKAAELADVAVKDMADNANKMGTDMGSIQFAYQGFAKQNYTMLDNLKLGYGGTKTEMERLVKDAAKLDKSVDANSLSYGNIVKAIHAVQVETGIYGTTQKEAEHTVTGSLNAMKASWGNLLAAMGSGENLDQCIDNMVSAVEIFAGNVMPVAERALGGLGTVVEKLAPIIADKLPSLAKKLLPPLIKATVSLTKGLIKALPSIIKTVVDTVVDILGDQFPALKAFGEILSKNAGKIVKFIPVIVALVAAFKLFKGVGSITSLFGGKSGGKSGKGGLLGGLTEQLKSLAKEKPATLVKGMANLAIIVGGFTLLTAAFMAIAPLLAKIGDVGSFTKMVVLIGVLGAVSTGLAKLSEIVGKINVGTVAKGLANMAIMLTGMSALFLLVGAVSLIPFDLGRVMGIVGILGALGAIGTALSIFAGIVGLIPVPIVALGLANMAIMVAGMSALFLLVGAVSLINFDLGRVMGIVGIIGVLGTIGAALSVFAGIVGLIPVPTVLLGLANMAIVVAGMSALLLLIGAVSLLNFDYKAMSKLIGIIGMLGLVGGALSAFAGIVGLIPIPVVLAGLANIALVLGGVTALIVAYGALSSIKGFNEFLTKGGETLAKLFNIIGKCVGSIIGGLGEGITNSLPKIGQNLSAFANSLRPMCEAFSGIDMGGIGAFFKAIGAFMLQMAGSKVLEFFAGKPDFTGLAEGLGTLATGEGVKNFFNMVNGIGEEAFNKGKLFFECLSGVKNLPNAGGLANLFGGENDFSGVATGLGQLASQGVKNFFAMVAGFDEVAFSNGKSFFTCLSNVKKLPNAGGLSELFGGKNDFTGVAKGLTDLSSEGVKNFFAMVAGFDENTFKKTKMLFQSLSDIKKIEKEGGFWQNVGNAISGKKSKSKLATIANDLGTFAEKSKAFFAQVNSLNLTNLNGLWNSLNGAEKVTANVSKKIDGHIDEIVKKVSDMPKKMGEAFSGSGKSLSDSFVDVWKEAVKASVAPVNKLLSGANHILKEFGSKKRVVEWEPYAKGTQGHKGGNALVNDGNGAELVQMPNGNTFIPKGRDVFIPNAPKGMKVLPADQTAQLMGKGSPTFRYADGVGKIDIWSFIDNSKGLANKIAENISYKGMGGYVLNVGKSMVSTFKGEMSTWIDKLFKEEGALSLSQYNASKGVSQWRSTVARALKMEGQYSAANVIRTLFQMRTESGGNPKAINLWDSNAKKGTPSKGLMQVIDPTFKTYARKGFDKNVYDPLSNILASIRYAVSRYGSLARAYRGKGYENGGIATTASIFGENGAEMAIPLKATKRKRAIGLWQTTGERLGLSYTPESSGDEYVSNSVENNTYSPQFTANFYGAGDDRTMARKVKRWIAEAVDDMVDGVSRNSPKVRG